MAEILTDPTESSPASALTAYLIERTYNQMGCDGWHSRAVRELMAKLGDTPVAFAARLRVRKSELHWRLEKDVWTKQDGFILTMLSRELDRVKLGVPISKTILATR